MCVATRAAGRVLFPEGFFDSHRYLISGRFFAGEEMFA
jgi:hypothetical protein